MKDYLTQAALTAPKAIHGQKVSESELRGCLNNLIEVGNWLDGLKKSIFYGKGEHLGEHVTCVNQSTLAVLLPSGTDLAQVEIFHGIIGAITETVELAEALMDSLENGKPLDVVNLSEECGDVLWYLACILRHSGKDFPDLQEQNIAKLRKRYPNGFLEYDALNRDLGQERTVLEATNGGKQQATAERASIHRRNGKHYLHGVTADHPKLAQGAEHVGYLFNSSSIVSIAYGGPDGDVVETRNTIYTIRSWDE